MTAADRQRAETVTDQLGVLLTRGTIEQLRAVGARLAFTERGLRPDALECVAWEPFDLPAGYVQLWFASGFTCGIDGNGAVSS